MRQAFAGAAFALALAAGPAAACTICHTPASVEARHVLLHHDLWRNASAVAAPVPLLLAAILWALREAPRRGETSDG